MADLIDRAALGIGKANPNIFEKPEYADGWNSVIDILQKAPKVDAVELIKENEEIKKAIDILNLYRNAYYKESSGTTEYAVANAINTILPLFAKCLERKINATD